jgi:cell volume regulation protein A
VSNLALQLLAIGALLVTGALASRASRSSGLPVALVFLAVGVLVGAARSSPFRDYDLAVRLGTAALVAILFDGGLNTELPIAPAVRPATVLATLGVVATTMLVALAATLAGLPRAEALLVGAIVSSTDGAAVFAVLRASGLQLKKRVGLTLELESGLNDPIAVILTVELTRALVLGRPPGASLLWRVPVQLAVGAAAGIAIGLGARGLLRRARLPVGGLYPVLTIGLSFVAFGAPSLAFGSGFLAVYLAGVVLGTSPMPYRAGVLRVHDTVAWLGQISMFFFLGLLASPRMVLDEAPKGIAIALALAFVARPVASTVCLLPFRYSIKETAYIGWVGLRGAVPIILATFPVLAHVEEGPRLFNLVFCIVVVNALVPGATVRAVTRWLGLVSGAPPPPAAVLEITSTRLLRGEALAFHIDNASAVAHATVADLPLPQGTVLMLISRGDELVAPRGQTVLLPGDHVHVFCRPEDKGFVKLLFGRPEE